MKAIKTTTLSAEHHRPESKSIFCSIFFFTHFLSSYRISFSQIFHHGCPCMVNTGTQVCAAAFISCTLCRVKSDSATYEVQVRMRTERLHRPIENKKPSSYGKTISVHLRLKCSAGDHAYSRDDHYFRKQSFSHQFCHNAGLSLHLSLIHI